MSRIIEPPTRLRHNADLTNREDSLMQSEMLGFVGVGRMGGPMSSRLLDAGYSLCVFDTNAEALQPLVARGAKPVGSPADVASTASTVLVSLPTPAVV